MSIREENGQLVYYQESTSTDRYTSDWGESTSSADTRWIVLEPEEFKKPLADNEMRALADLEYSDLDADWGANEMRVYNRGYNKGKKKEKHLLEDDLFEI